MRVKLWQLCRIINRIGSIKAESLEKDKSVNELISQEANSEIKLHLKECMNRTLRDEQETLRNLHRRAIEIYKDLQETKIGTQMLLANNLTAEFFYAENSHVAAAEPSKNIKALFSAFQFSWKIVRVGILLTVLSFGLAQLLSIVKISTFSAIEKIGVIFFLLTLLAAVIHSLISIVSSYTINKAKSIWSFVKTIAFETVLIALCLLFFFGLLKILHK
jgi:hypothetical protein